MKKIFLIFIMFFTFFYSSFLLTVDASIFKDSDTKIHYCNGNECGLDQGIQQIKKSGIDGIVTEGTASAYIQRVVVYILGFLSIIAIIIIIYAGFNMLTSAGDEDKAKKSKTIILYTILGLVIIYLAGPITTFVVSVLTQNPNV